MDEKVFNPERIGMQLCAGCSGSGLNDGEVCSGCGGFGFVTKIENIRSYSASNGPRSFKSKGKNRFQDLFFKPQT